jgi:peptide deformylase
MYELRTLPDPVLKQVSKRVVKFDRALKCLVEAMQKAMVKENGIGIAAPQVGVSKRVILVGFEGVVMINPKITRWGKVWTFSREGCLSCPEFKDIPVFRCKKIQVEFQRLGGTKASIELEDLPAFVCQHEIDHLDGVTLEEHAAKIGNLNEVSSI